jgi:hypothetical protein
MWFPGEVEYNPSAVILNEINGEDTQKSARKNAKSVPVRLAFG